MRTRPMISLTAATGLIDYLSDPEHTLTEIAYLLGYSEVSAFNRTFKRWTGSTPSDYRKKSTR